MKGEITRDRKLVVTKIPRRITPGAVEVILFQRDTQLRKRRTRRASQHPAFGIWAHRADISDSAQFAAQLRTRVERRADAGKRRR